MAVSLRQYAVVGFLSEKDALNAMRAALNQFQRRTFPSQDLSHCDGNIVYFHSDDATERSIIENFLLEQEGAQPRGCRCKV